MLVSTMDLVDATDLALQIRMKKRVGTILLSGIVEAFFWSIFRWRQLLCKYPGVVPIYTEI